jgi:DMSO/TMAO reductase YedYZ molybdopterin-dependent catalytic subunit
MNADKLIRTKMEWARQGRLLVPDPVPGADPGNDRRLPPGQTLVRDRPVLDLGHQPNLRPADWVLNVAGQVRRPFRLGWSELQREAMVERVTDIHCVTAWSRYDNRWRGAPLSRLLERAQPLPAARFAILKSHDGYTTTLPLADLLRSDVLLATHWDDEPLPRRHGGPVRLVVPHLYFWKSPKWLRQIWLTDHDVPGYWESRGYHPYGDPWRQQRYGSDR